MRRVKVTTTKKTNNEGPVGTPEGQVLEDALAASLGRLAYSIPKKVNRRSRFWFTMDAPVLSVSKEEMAPKKLEHIDSEIVDRLTLYQKTSPGIFQGNIEDVREFFLNEIAPKTLAVSGGTTQAAEVLRRLLDTDIDQSTAQRFTNMINRAATLRMAQFVVSYFGLDPKYVDAVIGLPANGQPSQGAADLKFILEHLETTTKLFKSEMKALTRKIEDAQIK